MYPEVDPKYTYSICIKFNCSRLKSQNMKQPCRKYIDYKLQLAINHSITNRYHTKDLFDQKQIREQSETPSRETDDSQ